MALYPVDRIEVAVGDITRLRVDAIVNAANNSLLGGGGVDGAIHRAAGPALLAECRTLDGCPTGQCKITQGYRLPAGHVLHCVGPVWQGGSAGEDDLLAGCYRSAIVLAQRRGLKSLAFPAISTGVFRFPVERATRIAVATVRAEAGDDLDRVVFACFDEATAAVYRDVLTKGDS